MARLAGVVVGGELNGAMVSVDRTLDVVSVPQTLEPLYESISEIAETLWFEKVVVTNKRNRAAQSAYCFFDVLCVASVCEASL